MRTDPRAEEVRGIVERVFQGYLREKGERHAVTADSPADSHSGRMATVAGAGRNQNRGKVMGLLTADLPYAVSPTGTNSQTGAFPRLFEPRCEERAGEDPIEDRLEIDETILIDQGRYVARSYRIEGYLAMWLTNVGILQFYDDRGRMLATINLFESLRPQRMAA